MRATLSAKNKKLTQAGKDRWGILINGSWWNTTNEAVGEVIDGLNKGDAVEVELAEKDGWKNVNAIELITDVNADVQQPLPEKKTYTKKHDGGENRDWSFAASYTKDVAIANATVSGDNKFLLPDNMLPLFDFFMSLKHRKVE